MVPSRLVLSLAPLLALTACGDEPAASGGGGAPGSSGAAVRVVVIPKGTTHQFWQAVDAGAQAAAARQQRFTNRAARALADRLEIGGQVCAVGGGARARVHAKRRRASQRRRNRQQQRTSCDRAKSHHAAAARPAHAAPRDVRTHTRTRASVLCRRTHDANAAPAPACTQSDAA